MLVKNDYWSCSRTTSIPTATSPSRHSAATSTRSHQRPCREWEGRLVGVDLVAARRAIDATVDFAQRELGDAWPGGMNPEIPERGHFHNPYQSRGQPDRRSGRRPRGDPRRAREAPGDREGVATRRSLLTEVGRADQFILLSDVTRTSVLIDAMEHGGDESGATASDVEGPLYVDDSPWRAKPVRVFSRLRGDGRRRRAVPARQGHVDRRHAAARSRHRHLADRPERRLRHLDERQPDYNFRGRGRWRRRAATTSSRRCCRSRCTVPTEGPTGRYLEAVGQHPWRPAHIPSRSTRRATRR